MAKVFIAYSQFDQVIMDEILHHLVGIFGKQNITYAPPNIDEPSWWDMILRLIAEAPIFVYLVSNTSLASSVCSAEYLEAIRLGKHLIHIDAAVDINLSQTDIPLQVILKDLHRFQHTQITEVVKAIKDGLKQPNADIYRDLIQSLTTGDVTGENINIGGIQNYNIQYIINSPNPIARPTDHLVREIVKEKNILFDENELIKSYLHWLIEQHSSLELRGIGGDRELPTMPLENVYVALKAEIETRRAKSYDIEQAHQELNTAVNERLVQLETQGLSDEKRQEMERLERSRLMVQDPIPTLLERDRPHQAGSHHGVRINLGNAIQNERWLVILGDPGSGKTTLSRWFTLKLARCMLDNLGNKQESDGKPLQLKVPYIQVDPDIDIVRAYEEFNLGQVRLPILLRVSDYAKAYSTFMNDDSQDALSLADFLGHHAWANEKPQWGGKQIPALQLNALFLEYLRQGKAVVLLDGMDEITSAIQRVDIVHMIENFIRDWINGLGQQLSSHEHEMRWNDLSIKTPYAIGGNQIIITSRIAGYHLKPISSNGRVAEVEILPMERRSVEFFCDSWTYAVQKIIAPQLKEKELLDISQRQATDLKTAIFDPTRPRVSELATNPLLITILALVYRKYQQQLPEQRTELYQIALEIFVDEWRDTGLTTKEIIYVLSPLAAHIHETSAQGYIAGGDMVDVIKEHLAKLRHVPDPQNPPPTFGDDIKKFLKAVQEQVGILAERGEDIYGFLHLTFQEYLAALWLIRDSDEDAADRIIQRLSDPRWREPILMVLGYTSNRKNWGTQRQIDLLHALLDRADPSGINTLIPRSALLIVVALNEMEHKPESILQDVAYHLIRAYADRNGMGRFDKLREQIERSFSILRSHLNDSSFEKILENILIYDPEQRIDTILAAAELARKQHWFTPRIMRLLILNLPHDNAQWGYPINAAIQELVAEKSIAYLEDHEIPEVPSLLQDLIKLKVQHESIRSGRLEAFLRKEIESLEKSLSDYDDN